MARTTLRRLAQVAAATALIVAGATTAAQGDPPLSCTSNFSQVPVPYPLDNPPMSAGMIGATAAISRNDVWFAGQAGTGSLAGWQIELLHYDGHRLREVPHPQVGSEGDHYNVNWGADSLSFDAANDGWLAASYMMNQEWMVNDEAFAGGIPAHPLVEHWNGKRWILTPIELDPAARFAAGGATSVLAITPSDAWLVGATGRGALIEHWDGRQWHLVPNPMSDVPDAVLYSVRGSSPDDLWAVGRVIDDVERTLIEHWDGHSWSVVPSPNPQASQATSLVTVSAVSADDAWAAGSQIRDGVVVGAREHWDGRQWSVYPDQGSDPATSMITAVRVLAPDDVYATSYDQLQHFDGHRWSTLAVRTGPAYGHTFRGLDVSDAGQVWAVGDQYTYTVLGGGTTWQNFVVHGCG